jgi:hypothetical protein
MSNRRDFRAKEIARLQCELANASQRLDALERRSRLRACRNKVDPTIAQGASTAPVADMPELRFAAFVASGMTKLQGRLD